MAQPKEMLTLEELVGAEEAVLVLEASLQSCFSEGRVLVTVRWSRGSATIAAGDLGGPRQRAEGEVQLTERLVSPSEAERLARAIVSAAIREEVRIESRSTTHHIAELSWRIEKGGRTTAGCATFHSWDMGHGEEMARLVREVLTSAKLSEDHKRMMQEGLAKGFYSRAIGLFDLAREVVTREGTSA